MINFKFKLEQNRFLSGPNAGMNGNPIRTLVDYSRLELENGKKRPKKKKKFAF